MSIFNLNLSTAYYGQMRYDIFYVFYRPLGNETTFKIPKLSELENTEKYRSKLVSVTDVNEFKYSHSLALPYITAKMIVTDITEYFIEYLNTTDLFLKVSILKAGDDKEQDLQYDLDFKVEQVQEIFNDGTVSRFEISLTTNNKLYFFKRPVTYAFRLFDNWVSHIIGIVQSAYGKNISQSLAQNSENLTIDFRGFEKANKAEARFCGSTDMTPLSAIEYCLNQSITFEDSLYFLIYNPLAGANAYYIWKYNSPTNADNSAAAGNVFNIKDRGGLTLNNISSTQNSQVSVAFKTWINSSEFMHNNFKMHIFNYDKGEYKIFNKDAKQINQLILDDADVKGLPSGFGPKLIKLPIVNESEDPFKNYTTEISSSNLESGNFWKRYRDLILNYGIPIITAPGKLIRLPGDKALLLQNLNPKTRNTLGGLTGVWSIVKIDHVFTPTTYTNDIFLSRQYSLTDIKVAEQDFIIES